MEVLRIFIPITLHPSCDKLPTTKVDTGFVNFVVEPSAMHALGLDPASAETGDSQQAFEPTCSSPRRNDGANNYYEHETAPVGGFIRHNDLLSFRGVFPRRSSQTSHGIVLLSSRHP